MKFNLIVSLLATILLLNAVNATCGTFPAGTLFCSHITLHSSGSTPAHTQVNFTFNATEFQSIEASNLKNINVYDTRDGSTPNCWIEGNRTHENQQSNLNKVNNLTVWCNIPDASWTTDTHYAIAFYSTSTNKFNSAGSWGEAPQISSSYGGNDNGALVFPTLYCNFTSLCSGWQQSGACLSISNGALIGNGCGGYIATIANWGENASQILDMYGLSSSAPNGGDDWIQTGYTDIAVQHGQVFDIDGWATQTDKVQNGARTMGALTMNNSGWYVQTVYWSNSSGATFWLNYSNRDVIAPGSGATSGLVPVGIFSQSSSTEGHGAKYYWMRIRNYTGFQFSATFGPTNATMTTTTTTSTTTSTTTTMGTSSTTTAGTSSTTTVPFRTTIPLSQKNIPYLLSYTILLGIVFDIVITLVGFGIGWMTSGKLAPASIGGLLMAIIGAKVAPGPISLVVVVIMGFLAFASIGLNLGGKKKG